MGNTIGLIWLAAALIGVVDALRRPQSDWINADKKRSFWITFMVVLGPLFTPVYFLTIRPRFGGSAGLDTTFRK